jgi:hypothetical protein
VGLKPSSRWSMRVMVPGECLFINLRGCDIRNHTDRSNCKNILAEDNTITKSFAKELPLPFLPSGAKHIRANATHGNLTRTRTRTATLPPNPLKPD